MALDLNGDGVDELEFVVGMLQLLGVELCGEPLRLDDVRPFRLQFASLDVSKTGKLSANDLDEYVKLAEQSAIARQDLLKAKKQAARAQALPAALARRVPFAQAPALRCSGPNWVSRSDSRGDHLGWAPKRATTQPREEESVL